MECLRFLPGRMRWGISAKWKAAAHLRNPYIVYNASGRFHAFHRFRTSQPAYQQQSTPSASLCGKTSDEGVASAIPRRGSQADARPRLRSFEQREPQRVSSIIWRCGDRNEGRISAWRLAQKRPGDLIVNASPLCIIDRIAGWLGVGCAATENDREYGALTSNLMYAAEKSMYMIDGDMPQIDNFYSDSLA